MGKLIWQAVKKALESGEAGGRELLEIRTGVKLMNAWMRGVVPEVEKFKQTYCVGSD